MIGSTGIAYFLYRLACIREDAELLATADLWAERAQRESVRPEAFLNRARSTDIGAFCHAEEDADAQASDLESAHLP